MFIVRTRSSFQTFQWPGSLGLSCSEQGVALAGVPLMYRDADGFQPRSQAQLRSLLSRAYGIEVDAAKLEAGLTVAARALNVGDMAYAMTAAVLMKLPELDWAAAVRIAQADDALCKYSNDESRDWHGRWTLGATGVASPAVPIDDPANYSDQNTTVPQRPSQTREDTSPSATRNSDAFALPSDWVHLPPGDRIDELGDFAEWIANAKPEDEPALRAEVKRLFYDVGDVVGGDSVNAIISDAVEPGLSTENRQELLDSLDRYTRADPAEMAEIQVGILSAGLFAGSAAIEAEATASSRALAEAAAEEPSGVWKLGWAARGQAIDKAFGNTLGASFPVIDDFAEGVVTSIKSIDLNAGTYQSGARLLARINSYVDKVSAFDGARWNNVEVSSSAIESRSLRLVIPKGSGTVEQQAAISEAEARAATLKKSVKLIVSPF